MDRRDLRADAVVVVDVQRALVSGAHAVADAEAHLRRWGSLLERARAAGVPVVHLQDDGAHDPRVSRGTPGWELVLPVAAGDVVMAKHHDDGFLDTRLESLLRDLGVTRPCLVGLQSEMCVAATARAAMLRGFVVVLPRDGHTTYAVPAAGNAPAVAAAQVSRVAEWSLGDQVVVSERTVEVRFARSPDALFADPRLARVYDTFDAPRHDLAAYEAMVGEVGARTVVDLGCGTGSLAVRLAARGLEVIGADPAAESLTAARAKPGADDVWWVHGDATSLPSSVAADLAVLTGNVAQVFLTEHAWAAALAGLRDALRPGGHLVFETRRPTYRAWERWAEDVAPVTRDVPGIGVVARRRTVTAVDLPLVSFRHDHTFPDGAVVGSLSTLRFWELDELEAGLAAAGFVVRDVRQAPDRPDAEYVVLAQLR